MPVLKMDSFKSEPFSQDEIARLKHVYHKVFEKGQSFIKAIPGYSTVPLAFEKFQNRIRNWQVRQDDIYVLTFPKNGTTWTQELVWLLQNDCNFKDAKATPLDNRFHYLELPTHVNVCKEDMPSSLQGDYLRFVEELPSPRLIKSHLHICLLPDDLLKKSKVVMCLRNPKDTVVSYYHYERLFKGYGYSGDFPTFFGLFMDNLLRYCSYFDYVKEAWQLRNHPNVCLLFFEDMKEDLAANVKKVARFLGKNVTDETVEALADHLSFANMKNNPAVNKDKGILKAFFKGNGNFMRKGAIGDWKNYFTDEMNKRMDEAIEKHFKAIRLEFQYE